MEIKIPKRLVLVLLLTVPSILFVAYYLILGKIIEAALISAIGIGAAWLLRSASKKRYPRKVDFTLTTVVFHMYSLSLGETSPEDLVRTIAENKEYGFYSKIFQRIRSLAKDFGYGITKGHSKSRRHR